MELVFHLLLVLHFIGLAGALGGFLAQLRDAEPSVTPLMLHGALTQWVTGAAMAALLATSAVEPGEWAEISTKVEVKFLVGTLVAVAAVVGRRRPTDAVRPWWLAIGVLEVVNVGLAVLW